MFVADHFVNPRTANILSFGSGTLNRKVFQTSSHKESRSSCGAGFFAFMPCSTSNFFHIPDAFHKPARPSGGTSHLPFPPALYKSQVAALPTSGQSTSFSPLTNVL